MTYPTVTQYPQELSFYLNRLQGYSRQIYRLSTLGATTATQGSIITVDLPSNALVNLDSLAMWFSASTGSAATALGRNIETIIQRLDVSINGVQVQTIDQYGRVFDIVESLTGSGDYRTKRAFLSNSNPLAIGGGDYVAAAADRRRFCINNWLGFLNSTQPSILDTSMLGNVRLTITLDSGRVLRSGAAPAVARSLTIDEIYFTVETIDIQDGIFGELHRKYLESGNVYEIPFTGYYTYTANTSNVKFNLSTQSLDAVYGTFVPAADPAAADATDNAQTLMQTYFNRSGGARNEAHQFNINGTFYPTYKVRTDEAYGFNLGELATAQDLVQCPILTTAPTAENWWGNKFVVMVRLAHPDSSGRLVSGLDTRGSMASCYYEASALPAATNGLVVAQTKSMLRVGYGRQLELVM